MKVVLITFLYDDTEFGGGAADVVTTLARQLRNRGLDVVVITTHGERKARTETVDGIRIYRFLPKNLYWVAKKNNQPAYKKFVWQLVDIWNADAFRQVKQILDEEKPDIVHVHKLRGLSPSVWKAAQASVSRRIVQTCHDYELMSPEGTLTSYVGKAAAQGKWFIKPYRKLRATFSRTVDVATAPSSYTLETLTKAGFFPQAEHVVIPNSHGFSELELEAIREQVEQLRRKRADGVFRLLYLGRLEAIKGLDVLAEAFLTLTDAHPEAFLEIVGWGSIGDALRQKYGHHRQITFHGALYGADKNSALANSDVMVVPSVCPEVFGNVVVEAYAHGLPVVATAAGGLPEVVKDGETGLLLAPGDPQALASALARILENPQRLSTMRAACYEAAQAFVVERTAERYLRIYENTICD